MSEPDQDLTRRRPQVTYCNKSERLQYVVEISGGKLRWVNQGNRPVHSAKKPKAKTDGGESPDDFCPLAIWKSDDGLSSAPQFCPLDVQPSRSIV